MELTTVKEIYRNREQYLDKEITVGGWVRSVRDSKAFGFIVLHDGKNDRAAAEAPQQEGRLYAGRADRGSGYSGNSGSAADSGADWLYSEGTAEADYCRDSSVCYGRSDACR